MKPKNSEEAVCYLSNPLVTLINTPITLPELKIVNAYVSKINPGKPTQHRVHFSKGELERLLGITKINAADLKKRLRNLFQPVIINDKDDPNHFVAISLFDIAEPYKDEDGLWQIDLACGESAKKYIFNIENIGYLRYYLSNIIPLKSKYSYAMFLYVTRHLTMHGSWTVREDSLRKFLGCTAKTYEQFYRFNDLVLKKCQMELNSVTDVSFSYKAIHEDGRVTKIRFTAKHHGEIPTLKARDDLVRPHEDLMNYILDAVTPFGSDTPYFSHKQILGVQSDILNGVEIVPQKTAIKIVREAFKVFCNKKETGEIKNDAAYFYRVFQNMYTDAVDDLMFPDMTL